MDKLICPCCAGPIKGRPYRDVVGGAWCQGCAIAAKEQVEDQERLDVGVGRVDLHARVLDVLTRRQQGELW